MSEQSINERLAKLLMSNNKIEGSGESASSLAKILGAPSAIIKGIKEKAIAITDVSPVPSNFQAPAFFSDNVASVPAPDNASDLSRDFGHEQGFGASPR